jgi:histidine triad (HIT) family protein
MPDDCLFCRIVRQDVPAPLLLDNATAVAFADVAPQAPHHYLVVPKSHVSSVSAVTDPELLGQLMLSVNQLAAQQGLTDYRVVINNGPQAGQSVFHLHIHVLGGRAMQWPPG